MLIWLIRLPKCKIIDLIFLIAGIFIRLYEQVKWEKNGGGRRTCRALNQGNGRSDKGAECLIEVKGGENCTTNIYTFCNLIIKFLTF